MSNEDTLPGFQFRSLYPPLRDCLADENEANAEIALTACRALTYLMEALPRSAMQVVEATPIFLSKVKSPSFPLVRKLFFSVISYEVSHPLILLNNP